MKQYNLFPTPLWHVNLEDAAYNKKLKDYILEKSKTKESVHKTNLGGGWQSDNLLDEEIFTQLKSQITDNLKSLNLNISKVHHLNLWCNVNYKNSWNVIHNHGQYHFAVVYYVKTPENSNKIAVRDPRAGFTIQWGSRFADKIHGLYDQNMIIELDVKEKDLIIFPGFLDHFVMPSASDEERISVALDCVCDYF